MTSVDPNPSTPAAAAPVPILEVVDLVKNFPIRAGLFKHKVGEVQAVSGVSFSVGRGETLGLVGESGCGKSTTGRCILRLIEPTSGTRAVQRRGPAGGVGLAAAGDPGEDADRLPGPVRVAEPADDRPVDHRRSRCGSTAPGRANGLERVKELMATVGLNPEHVNRFPHEFSGGQRQRIGIARALSLDPDLVVLDEPVSALDVSIQAGVVNLLEDLQERLQLAYVFIAHDLSVVRHICDMVAVMYLGKIVEIGDADDVYEHAGHPYTQALLSAVPVPDPRKERERRRIVLEGDVPSPANPPSGCRFRTRCWKAEEICAAEEPALVDRGQGHPVACHFAAEMQVV